MDSFGNYKNISVYYVQLQILHIAFVDIMGIMILPLTICATNLILFSNYILIRHWDRINLIVAGMLFILSLICIVGVAVTFAVFAAIKEKCKTAMYSIKNKNWGSRWANKEIRKVFGARKAISYGYGSMCVISKKSLLKFLKCITRGTFRTLLAL